MMVVHEDVAARGRRLHNELQIEHSAVGKFGLTAIWCHYENADRDRVFIGAMLNGERRMAFALTTPNHGSDATFLEMAAARETCDSKADPRIYCQKVWASAMHGDRGIGYPLRMPFEHIYRHYRRYRIIEGAEEIQMRKIAAWMSGFAGPNRVERNQGDQ